MSAKRALLVMLFAACLRTDTLDAGDAGADDGGTLRCAFVPGLNKTVCVTPPERVSCGGQRCEPGETCCYPTLTCVAPDAGTCASPRPGKCASDFDCADGEFCHSFGAGCDALGECMPLGACEFSGEASMCACDGHNYSSLQEICVAGVRGGARTSCGEPDDTGAIPCGFDSQCPEGQACCGITGVCIDANETWRCERLPDGGLLDCDTDQECIDAARASGGGPGSDNFCSRPSGCSGHGTCSGPFKNGSCGVVAYVCGCDGVTYLNECWAHAASTNVASEGPCP